MGGGPTAGFDDTLILPEAPLPTIGRVVATLALAAACARNDAGTNDSTRADTTRAADAADTVAPATVAIECPGVDSLALPDSLAFHPALPRGPDSSEPELFCFALTDGIYQLTNAGRGLRIRERDTTSFRLEWEPESTVIEYVLVRPYDGDVLLEVQVTDGESGSAELIRLDRAALDQQWGAHIPGFNIEPPLVDGQWAYVTAFGFVGQVNLLTGRFDWSLRDLYDHETGHFNSGASVTLHGDTVAFTSTVSNAPPRVLLFDRASGTLLGRRP